MHHHLRSAPSPPASPGTSIRRFYASGLIEAAEAGQLEEVEQALSRGIATDGRLRERRIDDATIALQVDDEESFRGKKPGRPAGRSALLLRVLAALLTAALLGAIVLYSQRPGLAPAAPPLDFEPL